MQRRQPMTRLPLHRPLLLVMVLLAGCGVAAAAAAAAPVAGHQASAAAAPAAGAGHTRLCLVTIVKNEAKQLPRMLASMATHISAYCLCDTGSTDGTPDLIKSIMDKRGVPGHVAHHTWSDFGHNRSLCFQAAAENLAGQCDYWMVADADHEVAMRAVPGAHGIATMKDLTLTDDCYSIREVSPYADGSLNDLPRLFRTDLEWEYAGLTHELPQQTNGDYCSGRRLREAEYLHHTDGGNRPTKHSRDLQLLQRAVAEHPDDHRTHFYLANTYSDLGMCTEAVAHYRRRIELGGWRQEIYISYLAIARCELGAGRPHKAMVAAASALAADPHRAEAPHMLASIARMDDDPVACYRFASYARGIGEVAPEWSLFIDKMVYRTGSLDEVCTCAFYAEKYEEGLRACTELVARIDADMAIAGFEEPHLMELRRRALENAAYYRDDIAGEGVAATA